MLPLAIRQKDAFTFNLEIPYYNWFYPLQYSHDDSFRTGWQQASHSASIRAVYIHFPFCASLCSFCPYLRTHVHDADLREKYIWALRSEIDSYGDGSEHEIDSIFFGGGTPSLMTPEQFSLIMDALRSVFTIGPQCEITIETNARSLTPDLCSVFRDQQVTTVRIGVQTFDPDGRTLYQLSATVRDVIQSVDTAHNYGLTVSFDLLFGYHGQALESFLQDIDHAACLGPETIEIYPLNLLVVPNRYWIAVAKAGRKALSARERITYFRRGSEHLKELGYHQWSGHGFANTPTFDLLYHRCVYGTRGGFVGFGPGAISMHRNVIKWNEPKIASYIEDICKKGTPATYGRRLFDHEYAAKKYVTELPYYGSCECNDEFIPEEIIKQLSDLIGAGAVVRKGKLLSLSEVARLQYASVMFYMLPDKDKEALGGEIFAHCARLGSRFSTRMLWI